MNHDDFLEQVYQKDGAEDPHDLISFIFNYIYSLSLEQNKIEECDEILKNIDVDKLGTDALLSFLTITYHAQNRLVNRENYLARVKKRSLKLNGRYDTKRLFGGFEKEKSSYWQRITDQFWHAVVRHKNGLD